MKIDKNLLSGSTSMLVLSLLAREEMYGYQMIVELSRRSDQSFQLKEGTLYPILHSLEAKKLVTAREKTTENGRKRRYYRITPQGLQALEEKKEAFRFFTEKVKAVVSTTG